MIADMFSNKKINPITIELFIRVRKLNIILLYQKILDEILSTALL